MQRSEEHDKAKYMAAKAEEEQQSTTSSITTKALDKKRRLEEEAKNKVGAQQLRAVAERLARSISHLAVLAQEQPEMMWAAPSPPAPEKQLSLPTSGFISCSPTSQAEEAMATYRTCIADANTQKQELEDTKVNSLRQIHELIKQSDQVIKLVSGAGGSSLVPQKAKGGGCRPSTAPG